MIRDDKKNTFSLIKLCNQKNKNKIRLKKARKWTKNMDEDDMKNVHDFNMRCDESFQFRFLSSE